MNWIQKYYIQPFIEKTGYNVVNASTYAILFSISAILFYYFLKKEEIKINKSFIYSSLTFVFWGAVLRALTDCRVLPFTFFTVSPGIFLTIFSVYFTSLFITQKFSKNSYKNLSIIGLILFGFSLSFWRPKNFESLLMMSSVYALSISPLFLLKGEFYNKFNKLAIASHFLDASTTFIGVEFFNYIEKFPLIGFFHRAADSALVIFPVKLVVLIPFLYFIDQFIKEKEYSLFIKFIIITLGVATGFRGFLQVSGLCH